MKHTPGPWWIDLDTFGVKRVWARVDGSTYDVACTEGDGSLLRETREADARLIAAAPDLLEACKFVIEDLAIGTEGYSLVKAAIAKAEAK